MAKQNELAQLVSGMDLQKPKIDSLMQGFTGYFSEARKIVDECKDINVSDEKQVDLMKQARESRLKLKEIRVNCEKTRKELKEQSLREGRAIDGIANVIKALIVPVEEHLEKQEKFAEVQEQLRLEKQLGDRVEKLSKYVADTSLYDLKDMADEVFNNLLAGCKQSWEKAKKEEDEAETEARRIADEETDRQEKIRFENEKLKKEAEERKRVAEIERQKYEEVLRKANEAKKQAEAKLRAEKETQVKKEEEEKRMEDAKNKAEDEEKRKALLAPDKEKLLAFATELSVIKPPVVKSREADQVMQRVVKTLETVVTYLQDEAKKL